MITHSQNKQPAEGFLKPNIGDQGNYSSPEIKRRSQPQPGIASHSFSAMPVFSPNNSVQSKLKVNAPGNAYEQAANRVEKQLPEQPHDKANAFTEKGSATGIKKLSESGRDFYQPFVGSAVHNANFHIGGEADELAKLSKAKALTVGNDIYIPENKFAPDNNEGRELIGHELTHVGQSEQAQAQIFRDEDEPHYPSEEEQKKIEKILGRERTETTVVTQTTGADGQVVEEETTVKAGKNLNEAERIAMANRLMSPLNSEIDDMVARAKADAAVENAKNGPPPKYSSDQLFERTEESLKKIYDRYGKYITRTVTLTKTDTTLKDRIDKDQIYVLPTDMATAAGALARTVSDTHCSECIRSLSGLNGESKTDVQDRIVKKALEERREFWEDAARLLVGGSYKDWNRSIQLPLNGSKHSMVHELIHAFAHPAFRAAFGDEDRVNEGFTEYFASQLESGNSYTGPKANVVNIKDLISGPFLTSSGTAGSAEESLRLAYFSGRLDLIGWQPTSDAERKAVEEAGGATQWDPAKAKEHAEQYKTAAIAKQDTHNNILGVGIYFERVTDAVPTFNVRYARVLTQTQPYSRARLLAEGQFIGSPAQKTLGGSLGLAGEFQEPYFFATAGARFIGEASLSGDPAKVNLSPFIGIGVRPWQTVRIGAEGFVLFPLTDGSTKVGAGGTVSVEF